MPIELERALEKSAEEKGLTGRRKDRYVYGAMRNRGWRPRRERRRTPTIVGG